MFQHRLIRFILSFFPHRLLAVNSILPLFQLQNFGALMFLSVDDRHDSKSLTQVCVVLSSEGDTVVVRE